MAFTGTVSFVATDLASGFTVGDPPSGTFQYDSDTADIVPADPMLGFYPGATGFAFDFGGYLATGNADAMGTGLFLLSGPATIFSDDSLPTSLELTDFTQRSASLEFTHGMTGPQVSALVESLTITVPEPGVLVLLAPGAVSARGRCGADQPTLEARRPPRAPGLR